MAAESSAVLMLSITWERLRQSRMAAYCACSATDAESGGGGPSCWLIACRCVWGSEGDGYFKALYESSELYRRPRVAQMILMGAMALVADACGSSQGYASGRFRVKACAWALECSATQSMQNKAGAASGRKEEREEERAPKRGQGGEEGED